VHTSAYVSIRERMRTETAALFCVHTSAYVSIRQRMRTETAALFGVHSLSPHALFLDFFVRKLNLHPQPVLQRYRSIRQHTSAYVSIRASSISIRSRCCRGTAAHVSIRQHTSAYAQAQSPSAADAAEVPHHTSAYVSISIRQHTSAHVSTRQHTSAYVSIRAGDAAELRQMRHIQVPIHAPMRPHALKKAV
jgi:hypothetical protein